MRTSVSILAFAMVVGLCTGEEVASPFNVADHSQLFVDKVLVREAANVAFSLVPARKHPENPVVGAEKPWEGWRLEIYGNVIYSQLREGLIYVFKIGPTSHLYVEDVFDM